MRHGRLRGRRGGRFEYDVCMYVCNHVAFVDFFFRKYFFIVLYWRNHSDITRDMRKGGFTQSDKGKRGEARDEVHKYEDSLGKGD